MSICKICEKNGYPGITIAWNNNIKTKEGRYVPLESDKVTPHKHYEPNGNCGNSNPTSAVTKEAIPIKQEMTIEELTEEFQILVKHMVEFLKQASK